MWLRIFSGRQFEETFENAQWGKAKQMQPMWLCILSGRPFEVTFEDAQWRKVEQMQPVRLCILSGRQFKDTFEDAQWGKIEQMQPVWICIIWSKQFEDAFENAQQGKSPTSVTYATLHHLSLAIWGHNWKHTDANKCNQYRFFGKKSHLKGLVLVARMPFFPQETRSSAIFVAKS